MTSPFIPGPAPRIAGTPGGPLAGLTFAAKDLFDVAGHPTGGGNPDWARQNPIPTRHAWAVQRLLDAGATLIGKTVTDEVSLGILLGAARPVAARAALLLGAKGDGLRAETRAAADLQMRIAMAPVVDSLNVATAAGIAPHRFRSTAAAR